MSDRNSSAEPRFLTLRDTARLLNISARQTFALVQSGELAAIRMGTTWRIERAVLESYIEAMYEATRRMLLWHGAAHADVAEPLFGSPQAADLKVVHISDYDMDRSWATCKGDSTQSAGVDS